MKKLKWALLTVLAGVLFITGCTKENTQEQGESKVLTVGATAVPHAEILSFVKPMLEAEGIELKIVEYSDYNTPNIALAEGSLDANYFQHIPYMEQFATDHNLALQTLTKVHIEPMGIYSEKIKSLDDLEQGAKVSIPNDQTNGGRALLLLQEAGLITLKADSGVNATLIDVVSNPKNLVIKEVEAALLPRTLDSVDVAVINTNYALQAGFVPTEDALLIEDANSPYVNIVTVRNDDENALLKKLDAALQTQEVKDFINEKYQGEIGRASCRDRVLRLV